MLIGFYDRVFRHSSATALVLLVLSDYESVTAIACGTAGAIKNGTKSLPLTEPERCICMGPVHKYQWCTPSLYLSCRPFGLAQSVAKKHHNPHSRPLALDYRHLVPTAKLTWKQPYVRPPAVQLGLPNTLALRMQ